MAFSQYLSEDIVSPPNQETFGMLGRAFARISEEFETFTPQDFALYAMSVLHQHIPGIEASDQTLRRGAMRYLLDVKPRLSPVFQDLSDEARAFLEQTRSERESAAATDEVWGPFERAFPSQDVPRQKDRPIIPEARASLLPELEPPRSGIPYRRLDLAAANRGPGTAGEPSVNPAPITVRSKRRRSAKKRYGALGVIFLAMLTGTGVTTYIALTLLFVD